MSSFTMLWLEQREVMAKKGAEMAQSTGRALGENKSAGK
jgi:hypothetical protein